MSKQVPVLCVVALLFLAMAPLLGHAQMRVIEGDEFLKTADLKLGDPAPDVHGYDIDGKAMGLRDFKGHYTVIVSGCLT